jgi:hypothetical protein
MGRCVCTHIRALHRDGQCMLQDECGCSMYETPQQADRISKFPTTDRTYEGRYSGRKRWEP